MNLPPAITPEDRTQLGPEQTNCQHPGALTYREPSFYGSQGQTPIKQVGKGYPVMEEFPLSSVAYLADKRSDRIKVGIHLKRSARSFWRIAIPPGDWKRLRRCLSGMPFWDYN